MKGTLPKSRREGVQVLDADGRSVTREEKLSELSADAAEKGQYPHYMLKEIHEQPLAVANTLKERVANGRLLEAAFGPKAAQIFPQVEYVRIVACGTSYHAGRGRPVLHRADLPHSLPRRDRQRIPLPQCGGAEEHAVRDHLPVRGNGRHAGRAAAGQAERLPGRVGGVQFTRELAGARVGSGHADAGRSRDRRGFHQGLHHADRGAVAAGDRAGQDAWHRCRARARPGDAPGGAARPHREDPGAGSGDPRDGRALRRPSTTRCSWAVARCIRWRWKAR